MSDEIWRRRGGSEEPEPGEFGGPLFPDDPADTAEGAADAGDGTVDPDDTSDRRLRFGPDDTGPLPHWTAPPTGEIPRLAPPSGNDVADDDDSDEVDVWSTFTTESPVWRDDDPVTGVMEQIGDDFPGRGDPSGGADRSGGLERDDASAGYGRQPGQSGRADATAGSDADYGLGGYGDQSGDISTGMGRPYGRGGDRGRDSSGAVPVPRREPGRITIGTDPSGAPRRQPEPGRRRSGQPSRQGRQSGPARSGPLAPRNMSNAIVFGAAIAAAFVGALFIAPAVVLGIIVAVIAVAAYEYFGKVTEKGYRPAVAPGLLACVSAPLAAYWLGDSTLPLVVAFAFMAGAIGFIGASGVESGPLPNMAITTMGVVWIGLLGAYAALILRFSTAGAASGGLVLPAGSDYGTDTLFMLALGVAANDIGALVVGSAAGKTPLRAWISPSKTVEGLIGGALATVLALFVASRINDNGTWTDLTDVLLLALVIAVMAPLGDLTESMFKRNLDVKDFGTVIQGHGGVLDRFDGFLFALPAVYYLTLVITPGAP